jgi:hypothetical protein
MSSSERSLRQARQEKRKLRSKREADEEGIGDFQRLKAIAKNGPVAFCKEALGYQPTKYQVKFLEDTAQFITQLWSRQCVGENTFVYLSNGNISRIKDLPEAWCTGKKECFIVHTEDGREIIATAEHRFLTRSGWKRLDQLKRGTKIIVPDMVPVFGQTDLSSDRVKILAYLITDGCFGHQYQSVKFTGKEPYISEMESCIRNEFPGIYPRRYRKGNCIDLLLTAGRGNVREHTLNAWLRKTGFSGRFSEDRFRLARRQGRVVS